MDQARFWEIIDSSRESAAAINREPATDFIDVHLKTLADALSILPPDEVISFDEHFRHYLNLAYRWDLWGAAYWLHGGCGDDGFIDFRSCLISTGKQNFDRVLSNPDHLAEIEGRPDIPYLQLEGFQYVASKVYKSITGDDMAYDTDPSVPREPAGEQFDFDDEKAMAGRYPKLVQKYPEMGD